MLQTFVLLKQEGVKHFIDVPGEPQSKPLMEKDYWKVWILRWALGHQVPALQHVCQQILDKPKFPSDDPH